MIDQVNTVFYNVEIEVNKGKQRAGLLPKPFDFSKLTVQVGRLKTLINPESDFAQTANSEKKALSETWNKLEKKIKDVAELNKELDILLYSTLDSKFYIGGPNKVKERFAKIQSDAKVATEKFFSQGTPQAICDDAEAVIQKVRDKAKKLGIELVLGLPKDLSDPSNDIATAFRTVVEKLQAIETSTWSKADTKTRILKEEIEYICTFTPKEQNPKLKPITRTVTITPTVGLSGILFTGGPFMTDVRDDHYVPRGDKIALGGQDRFAMPLGYLAHAVICGKDFSRFSLGFAASTGFAVGTGTENGKLLLDAQAALGGSIILSGPGGRRREVCHNSWWNCKTCEEA